jgi:glycosyltransferase involved in cell wall biosynthesis
MKLTASVVVPTYNRADGIERILRPLLDDPATEEVVVVVDGSPDGTADRLRRLEAAEPRLRAVVIENRGEMGAREIGAREARGDVVVFIDDDVLAEPGLVSGHVRAHSEIGDGKVVVGYMPIAMNGHRTAGDFATRLYGREYEGRCVVYEAEPGNILRNLWGGNFSMRRDDCLAVGLRNRDYTERYHPDRDFGIRCMDVGLTGVFDRSLVASHLHTRSLPSFLADGRSQGAGRALLHHLHPEVLGRLEADAFEEGLPAAGRWLVRAARRPRVHAAASRVLCSVVRAGGRARAWPVQDVAARLLRRLEQQRGAIDAAHGRRA